MDNTFYRVVVVDKNYVELTEHGLFETMEGASTYVKLHRFEITEPDQFVIKKYRPMSYAKDETELPEYSFVTFDSFVKAVDNPESDIFIDTEARNWYLEVVNTRFEDVANKPTLDEGTEPQTIAFVSQVEDDPTLSHFSVTFPVKTSILLRTPKIEVELMQAKLKIVASKIFTTFSRTCKVTKVEDVQRLPRVVHNFNIEGFTTL